MRSGPLPSRQVVLGTQLTFNIGFYAVVPFIAIHMQEDLAMSSAIIGLVLGIRTFSQQGMFVFGGWLAGCFGYRALMMAGCLMRVAGYLGLAGADSAMGLVISAALTGIGGALFSPCLEALTAEIDHQEEVRAIQKNSRPAGLFARFAVFGEFGAVAGPVLGGWMMNWGFAWTAVLCAGIFAAAGCVLYFKIPSEIDAKQPAITWASWKRLAANRAFLWFALAYSTYLFSYNQLYMALPAELARIHAPDMALSWLFVLASVLIIALQMPIARLCGRWSENKALATGFLFMALSFVGLAVGVVWWPADFSAGYSSLLPTVMFVILLSLGQMFVVPTAMSLVPRYAEPGMLPVYYGLLASAGGLMVLIDTI